MSWFIALYNRQNYTVIPDRKETHEGSSTTTLILCRGKTSQWHSELDSRQNVVVLLGWGGRNQEFSRPEEAGICNTGHQRRGSYTKEDLQKSIWRFYKGLWLRTRLYIHRTRLHETNQREQSWKRNRNITSWFILRDVGAAGNKSAETLIIPPG